MASVLTIVHTKRKFITYHLLHTEITTYHNKENGAFDGSREQRKTGNPKIAGYNLSLEFYGLML